MVLTSDQRAAKAAADKRQRQVEKAVAAAMLFLQPRMTLMLYWMPSTWSEFADRLGQALDAATTAGDEAAKAVYLGFDSLDPATVNAQRAQRDKMVADLVASTKKAVNQVVTWAQSAGISAEARDGIMQELAGLNANQISPILTTLASMASTGSSDAALVTAARKSAKGVIEERSAIIASDALWSGAQLGQVLAGGQMKRQTNYRVTKTWNTAGDERVCSICGPLDGVKVGIDEFFPGGLPAPAAHPNCRCHTTIDTEDPDA